MGLENRDCQLLQALCQTGDESLRRRALELLPRHRWSQNDHQLLFEFWAVLVRSGVPVRRETMAAQATRVGFPDLDFDSLFVPMPSPDASLARMLQEIASDSRRCPSEHQT